MDISGVSELVCPRWTVQTQRSIQIFFENFVVKISRDISDVYFIFVDSENSKSTDICILMTVGQRLANLISYSAHIIPNLAKKSFN